ncbi:hypothetical protein H1R20_g12419, partial [Candolleomyces eurysporus]
MESKAATTTVEDMRKVLLPEIVEGARASSIPHLEELCERMKGPGPECYSIDLLDIHLAYLQPPKESPSQHEFNLANRSLMSLTDVEKWCIKHPSLRKATARRIRDSLEGIISWIYRIQDIPERWTTQILTLDTPRCLESYERCARALYTLHRVHDVLYQACLHNVLAQEMCIGWWVMTYHDGAPYYPDGHPSRPDKPDHQMADTVTQLFWSTVKGNPCLIANKIMEGSVCSPEAFVGRTLERMRVLMILHELEHLSLAHPETIELRCIQCILLVTESLIQADSSMAALFIRADAQVVYAAVLSETSDRLCAQRPTERSEIENRSRNLMLVLCCSLCTVRWQCIISNGVLARAKGVITQGVVRIVANAIKVASTLGDDASFPSFREIFDGLTVYSTYPSVFTMLVKEIKRHLGSYHSSLERGSPECVILDRWMSTFEIFSVKHNPKDRDIVCDNMDHMKSPWRSTSPLSGKTCSHCRSVVYCSEECQKADWNIRHRAECPYLNSEYKMKKAAEISYCNSTRSFQLSILKYVFELRMTLWIGAPSFRPNSTVKLVHSLDLVDSDDPNTFESLDEFLTRTVPMIAPYTRPRFDEIIRRYEAAHAAARYAAENQGEVRLVRLLNGIFMHGSLDVNMLILLHEVSSGSATRKSRNKPKFSPNRPHDPSTKADLEIETSLVYFCPHRHRYQGGSDAHMKKNLEILWGDKLPSAVPHLYGWR